MAIIPARNNAITVPPMLGFRPSPRDGRGPFRGRGFSGDVAVARLVEGNDQVQPPAGEQRNIPQPKQKPGIKRGPKDQPIVNKLNPSRLEPRGVLNQTRSRPSPKRPTYFGTSPAAPTRTRRKYYRCEGRSATDRKPVGRNFGDKNRQSIVTEISIDGKNSAPKALYGRSRNGSGVDQKEKPRRRNTP